MKFSASVKALGIQFFSLLICLAGLYFFRKFYATPIDPLCFLLVQGLLASLASVLFRFDWWWGFIQFVFPLISYFFFLQSFPSYVYLIALIFCSLLFWSTYRTQVPYYPSRENVEAPIVTLLSQSPQFKFIDVGSGMGGLLFGLERQLLNGTFYGIEIAPLPWMISQVRRFFLRSKTNFIFDNYLNHNVGDFDVVFCYLSPAVMAELWEKAKSEMKPGSLLLSYEFIIPDVPYSLSFEIEGGASLLYGWRM